MASAEPRSSAARHQKPGSLRWFVHEAGIWSGIMAVRGTDIPLAMHSSFAGSDRCPGVTKYASVSAR